HEALTEEQRLEGMRRHAAQVRSRMDELSLKAYWNQFAQAPEFVVLVLPGETVFGSPLEHDPRLIEDGFLRSVVLATPTTLMALLRDTGYGWPPEHFYQSSQE